jgi:hypothetical protein
MNTTLPPFAAEEQRTYEALMDIARVAKTAMHHARRKEAKALMEANSFTSGCKVLLDGRLGFYTGVSVAYEFAEIIVRPINADGSPNLRRRLYGNEMTLADTAAGVAP